MRGQESPLMNKKGFYLCAGPGAKNEICLVGNVAGGQLVPGLEAVGQALADADVEHNAAYV